MDTETRTGPGCCTCGGFKQHGAGREIIPRRLGGGKGVGVAFNSGVDLKEKAIATACNAEEYRMVKTTARRMNAPSFANVCKALKECGSIDAAADVLDCRPVEVVQVLEMHDLTPEEVVCGKAG